jgi:hypothetical protein
LLIKLPATVRTPSSGIAAKLPATVRTPSSGIAAKTKINNQTAAKSKNKYFVFKRIEKYCSHDVTMPLRWMMHFPVLCLLF